MDLEMYSLEEEKDCKWKGIMNSGNICYFNSLIQILFFIKPLRKIIIEDTKKSKMMENLQEFFCERASK